MCVTTDRSFHSSTPPACTPTRVTPTRAPGEIEPRRFVRPGFRSLTAGHWRAHFWSFNVGFSWTSWTFGGGAFWCEWTSSAQGSRVPTRRPLRRRSTKIEDLKIVKTSSCKTERAATSPRASNRRLRDREDLIVQIEPKASRLRRSHRAHRTEQYLRRASLDKLRQCSSQCGKIRSSARFTKFNFSEKIASHPLLAVNSVP